LSTPVIQAIFAPGKSLCEMVGCAAAINGKEHNIAK